MIIYSNLRGEHIVIIFLVLFVTVIIMLKLFGIDIGSIMTLFQNSKIGGFFKSQGPNIITLVIMFMTVLVLFKILGVNFNPPVEKHISKVVTVESMNRI